MPRRPAKRVRVAEHAPARAQDAVASQKSVRQFACRIYCRTPAQGAPLCRIPRRTCLSLPPLVTREQSLREGFMSRYENNTKEFRTCCVTLQWVCEKKHPENQKARRQQGALFFPRENSSYGGAQLPSKLSAEIL